MSFLQIDLFKKFSISVTKNGLLSALFIIVVFSMACEKDSGNKKISLRTFPYPFKGALTLADDIDRQSYREFVYIQNFFHEHGLEIGGSFWMYHDSEVFPVPDIEFSYFEGSSKTKSQFAEAMTGYIRSGIMESLHTFAQTQPLESSTLKRDDYRFAVDELKNNIGVRLKHWINHGDSPDKIGDVPANRGDNPDSEYYHTDFTNADKSNGYYSFEFYHTWDGYYNEPCYVHPDTVLWLETLDDGSKAYKYTRYHGVSDPPRSDELHIQLRDENLRSIIENGAVCVIYMHLGTIDAGELGEDGYDHGIDDVFPPLDDNGKRQLIKLAEHYKNGEIYVTTATKLFQYFLACKKLNYTVDDHKIIIHTIDDEVSGAYVPDLVDLQGITFYTPAPRQTSVFIGDTEVTEHLILNPDDGNNTSLSFPLLHITRPGGYPALFLNTESTIYSQGGIYHSISYDKPMLDKENELRLNMNVRLKFNSGILSIYPSKYDERQIAFTANGTTEEMWITIFSDQNKFKIENGLEYILKRNGEIINTQQAQDNKVQFQPVAIGGSYTVTRL